MVLVYFESKSHAEQVATFDDEKTYQACVPALEALAAESNMIVTESVVDDYIKIYHKNAN
jgi:hypothetical protein